MDFFRGDLTLFFLNFIFYVFCFLPWGPKLEGETSLFLFFCLFIFFFTIPISFAYMARDSQLVTSLVVKDLTVPALSSFPSHHWQQNALMYNSGSNTLHYTYTFYMPKQMFGHLSKCLNNQVSVSACVWTKS